MYWASSFLLCSRNQFNFFRRLCIVVPRVIRPAGRVEAEARLRTKKSATLIRVLNEGGQQTAYDSEIESHAPPDSAEKS